jgi:dTDP-4-amino-4,6-dideoxygalactose transaminase
MKPSISRRRFLESTSLAGAGFSLTLPGLASGANTGGASLGKSSDKPAKLGGKPVCSEHFPGWPVFDETEEKALHDTLHSGQWYRGSGKAVAKFESAFEKLTGAKHCLVTASGTAALYTALGALDLGPGDEVIIPPYTFVATYNAVVLNYALPVFVDTDLESFQIDANKIEDAITPATRVIMPVHLGGYPANLDKILEVGERHKIPVIEDACQAHLGEWRGRKVGTWGLAGCFSFQASKNLNSGEGGAVLTNDDQFAKACSAFHNQGRGGQFSGAGFAYSATRGSNLRLSEFQGGMLSAQMTRVIEQSNRRNENGIYLTKLLGEIPGIKPAKLYDHATRSAYHLYMFRYDKAQFAGLDHAGFLAALNAEGVPCSGGYGVMNKEAYVTNLAKNKHFLKIYGEQKLKDWLERNQNCPENDKLCDQAVWFTQTMLLADRTAMDQIGEAIRKIQKHAAQLAKA